MSQTIMQKGYKIIIPNDIQKRTVLKEGEKLIVKLAGSDTIVLQRPPREKDKKEAIEETFGIWENEFTSNQKSIDLVNKIRKAWRRKVG